MSLRSHLAALLSPVTPGTDLVQGVRFLGASDELGLRLSFEAAGTRVHVELSFPEDGHPHAAASERLCFSYRAGSSDAPVSPELGLSVCAAVAEACAANEHRVLDDIARAGAAARAADHGGAKVREVQCEQLLQRGGTDVEPFYTLSPYVGCLIGCRFCYAQTPVGQVRALSQLPPVRWGSYVDVRVNAPEVLREELAAAENLPIKFCPIVSDPYQAVESRYRLTRQCLEVIAEAGPRPVMVLTRSSLVTEDAALLARLPRAYVGVSIGTVDEAALRHFEPRAASAAERLDTLEALQSRGIATFAVVQPLLPGSVDALADALASRVGSVSIDVLRGVQGAIEEFAHPQFGVARDPAWQRDRAAALASALRDRGVSVWHAELPPGLRDLREPPQTS